MWRGPEWTASGTRGGARGVARAHMKELDTTTAALRTALAGRYEIERLVDRGGHGLVFLARELRLDRLVALKVLSPARQFDADARARFLHEARIAARLWHPHIVPIFAADEAGGFVFYAMAYVAGETLATRARRGPLAPAEAVRVLTQTAAALAYAHARGVIHRDVKPENILLEHGSGRALVADFGIARLASGAITGPGRVRGTAAYVSPEQVTDQPLDGRSDLYALGVVGFHILAGRLPFTAADDLEMLARHVTEPAPRLDAVAPWVPRWLAAAIGRCLEKSPDARFPDAEALIHALGAEERPIATAPLAVRAFLTESRHLSVLALAYGVAVAGGAVPFTLGAWLWSDDPVLRGGAAGALVTLLAAGLAFAVRRVRRLLAAGQGRSDLVAGLEADLARRREELAFVYGDSGTRIERAARRLSYAGVALAAVGTAALLSGLAPTLEPGALGAAAGGAVALLAALVSRARTEQRTDPRGERRLKFWRGPLGRGLFALARLGLPAGETPAVTPVTGG
jgi:eukaryotic-like serine/threonine-protein kinase